MPSLSRFRLFHLLHLSHPKADRLIYRALHQRPVRSIVELGVDTGQRAMHMLELASLHTPMNELRYTGIDLFEARGVADGPGLTLKEAHRLLKPTGAKIQLLPGDPLTALSRAANSLGGTDLVVISASQDPRALAQAWFYLPRMLHAGSEVFCQQITTPGQITVRQLTLCELNELAGTTPRRRAA